MWLWEFVCAELDRIKSENPQANADIHELAFDIRRSILRPKEAQEFDS